MSFERLKLVLKARAHLGLNGGPTPSLQLLSRDRKLDTKNCWLSDNAIKSKQNIGNPLTAFYQI